MNFTGKNDVEHPSSTTAKTTGWAVSARPVGLSADRDSGRRWLEVTVLALVVLVLMLLGEQLRADELELAPGVGVSEATGAFTTGNDTVSKENDLLPGLSGGDGVLSAAALEAERATAMLEVDRITINDQDLNGVVSNNSAIDTISGNNTIAGDAFGNATGFIGTIQNTGNNVLIQSATIVNIAVEP